jgi:subtilisin family serine protease
MATPHVTGTVALLAAQNPALDWRALKNLILTGGEARSSLAAPVL